MTKAPRPKKSVKKRSPHHHEPQGLLGEGPQRRVLVIATMVVLAGVPFVLGKYFEFKSPGAFDSGSYVYSAQHVLSGARIGYEEKPSAQAGTLLFNMLGVKLFGFRETGSEVLQMLLQAAALIFMCVTLRRLYGTLVAVIAVFVTSIYLSAPLIAKYGNVKEQFMIAFMILGICCFIFYHLTGKWWWCLLTGLLLVWGPMFKQTGLSAIGAVGLLVLAQPLLHRAPWKKAGKEALLLVAGAAITLTPIAIWYASMDTPLHYWPYSFLTKPMLSVVGVGQAPADPNRPEATEPAAQQDKPESSLLLKLLPGYVRDSWQALGPPQREEAFQRVLRYYRLLILPILLALGAIIARIAAILRARAAGSKAAADEDTGRFVLLLALWWFFDMAFVWISPRSYEQYYLPLNASGTMLGGYLVGAYADKLRRGRDRNRWIVLGLLGLVVMLVTSWHIFFGIQMSPHSGAVYKDPRTGQPQRRRGYLQKWQEVSAAPQYPWERVGEYVREHSETTDRIYVWGWVPGIYVKAQRFSSAQKAFEGTMHTLPPAELASRVQELLAGFEKDPPKFIVDTRKDHFPWSRPALELWPIAVFSNGQRVTFLPADDTIIQSYDQMWGSSLGKSFGADEAARYEAVAPLRAYVMQNYRVVEPQRYRPITTKFGLPSIAHEAFGMQVVFARK